MLSRHLSRLLCVFAAVASAAAVEPAAAPAPETGDLQHQLADTQDKLSTSLRSYSLLQDENSQLKSDLDKAQSDKAALAAQLDDANQSIAVLKGQAAAAAQLPALRTQLRQLQDEAAALAAENARLRTLLALRAPAPGGAQTPTRPPTP